jgi:hypothetical protein
MSIHNAQLIVIWNCVRRCFPVSQFRHSEETVCVDDSLGILHKNMTEIKEEDLTPCFSIAREASNYGSSRMFHSGNTILDTTRWYAKSSAWFFIPILKNLLRPQQIN